MKIETSMFPVPEPSEIMTLLGFIRAQVSNRQFRPGYELPSPQELADAINQVRRGVIVVDLPAHDRPLPITEDTIIGIYNAATDVLEMHEGRWFVRTAAE